MRKLFAALTLLFCVLVTQSAHAVTVWYQPTPFPAVKVDGITPINKDDITIVHALEGWVSSYYYGQAFQRTNSIQIGGDGIDVERLHIKFDLVGLPQHVDSAVMYLLPYSIPSQFTSTPFTACPTTSAWDSSMTWIPAPTIGTCYGYSAPVANTWSGFYLSYPGGSPDWYNQWQSGAFVNNGIELFPQTAQNNFDAFFSTLYNSYATDPYADARRPALSLTFTPPVTVPGFQMPLPGGTSWLVTNEAGGYECMGEGGASLWPDPAHTGNNYFSIDISPSNHDVNGNTVYTGNILVIAAASGVVVYAGVDSSVPGNGYFVVINHSNDPTNSVGFSTRYLHMQSNLQVYAGQSVTQGQLLGYMGNTGDSTATHLHFGMRYATAQQSGVPAQKRGDGSTSSSNMVQYVTMEGLLMKSYQTECAVNANGVPTSRIRYYLSNNVGPGVYPTNN